MTTTEQQLIEVSREIGALAGCNSSFTAGLAQIIDATGLDIQDMPLCELLRRIRDYRKAYRLDI
jgi:hypothetical protein